MSDYVRKKVIRYPFPKEILSICNTNNPWDCEEYLESALGELYASLTEIKRFNIECTDKAWYVDWVYYYTYGEESADFGNVSQLTGKELELMVPHFKKLGIPIDDSKFRKVDFCYYNCCECSDYYELQHDELTEDDLF